MENLYWLLLAVYVLGLLFCSYKIFYDNKSGAKFSDLLIYRKRWKNCLNVIAGVFLLIVTIILWPFTVAYLMIRN